uniref:Uncharacterized protein n=1 Tax=Cacopsylla melanoneura TaxID=428564 RepID=A0A8D9B3T4_9HEMI
MIFISNTLSRIFIQYTSSLFQIKSDCGDAILNETPYLFGVSHNGIPRKDFRLDASRCTIFFSLIRDVLLCFKKEKNQAVKCEVLLLLCLEQMFKQGAPLTNDK